MTITPAGLRDLPAIGRLYEELYECMAALQPDNFRPGKQSETFIRSTIEDEKGDVLVARDLAGEVVGFALVHCQNTPEYPSFVPRRYTHLLDIVVTKACRGQGVGKALLAEVERWAREKSSEFVELGVLSENLPAIKAYESYGFMERRKVMELKLSGSRMDVSDT